MIENWDRYPNFGRDEFKCSHCGEENMDPEFMDALQELRDQFGPMQISSGYRCANHKAEKRKAKPGTHFSGKAADIAVSRGDAVKLLRLALLDGRFSGFGIQQKKGGRFIHLDSTTTNRPTIWSY
jgi:zinc D-Ala-D-Ala carboxypeptidase